MDRHSQHIKNIYNLFSFLLLNLFFSLPQAYGFDFPLMGPDEIGHFLIDPESADKLILGANYGTSKYGGLCYGIDRLNFTLLSRVNIVTSEQVDSDELIYEKLVSAYYNSQDVTIFSASSSPAEFMKEIHKRWRQPSNPINRAIENIFNSPENIALSRKEDPMLQMLIGYSLTPPPSDFIKQIKEGMPVSIGIISGSDRHKLTIYGFKETNTGDKSVFYVLDSNRPGRFQELTFDRNQHHWYYETWKAKVDIIKESVSDNKAVAMRGKFSPYSLDGKLSCREIFSY